MHKVVSNISWLLGPFIPIVVAWEIVARSGIFPSIAFPPASVVAVTWWNYVISGELWPHVLNSLLRLCFGTVVGLSIGVIVGLAMGISRTVSRFCDPIVNLGQAIPALAWIPLAIIWFGLGYKAVTFIIFLSIVFPVLLNTSLGVRSVPQVLVNAALTLGASRWQVICRVFAMGALPSIFLGFRIGIGFGWRALVAGEMIAASSGLGYLIFDARQFLRSDVVIMGMLTIGILWVCIDRLFLKPLERRTVERWSLVRE